MSRLSENKVILLVRKTRLDELIQRFNTLLQAKFYIEHLGADFSLYVHEDQVYKQAVCEAQKIIDSLGRLQTVERSFLPNFMFGKQDVVVVLGQDGLVANVLKYLENQPVIGINPDPASYEGVLLPFRIADLHDLLLAVFHHAQPLKRITMAKAQLTNGHTLYSVNDFFIGCKSHTSARYRLEIGRQSEYQSSSGVIVSTGLGSSGWLKSVLAGATSISANLLGQKLNSSQPQMPWDADYLYFSVREPWPSKTSSASLTFGKVTAAQPLKIDSQMPENGVIFSDGIEEDFVEFQAGTQAVISLAEKQGHLVIN